MIATAGHVDHGKSTLVRALTGMEPDRWAEERRRGMTIDLGYAWTGLPGGDQIAFVDVPGHERFLTNMLAGVGPTPAVLLVIAADEGWCRQTSEHVAALSALGVTRGVLAVTRADLGDADLAIEEARDHLAGTGLDAIEAVAVSPVTGTGLDELRAALGRLVAQLPPAPRRPTRLWIDRVFMVRGAGTVVTGTLQSGTLSVGDEVRLFPFDDLVHVRGLESMKSPATSVSATARVAVNLRLPKSRDIHRGFALVGRDDFPDVDTVDVRLIGDADELATHLVFHVGSAAVPVRVRALGGAMARLTLDAVLPVRVGERGALRDPGRHSVVAGVEVLDVDPPPLTRRGAAAARAAELAETTGFDLVLRRGGAARRSRLHAMGVLDRDAPAPPGTVEQRGWLIAEAQWAGWRDQLPALATRREAADPVSPWLPRAAAAQQLALPDPALLDPLIAACDGLTSDANGVHRIGVRPGITGPQGVALDLLVARLGDEPFAAADAEALAESGLDERHLSAAVGNGRLMRVAKGIYLLPDAADLALVRLADLAQPFSLSEARQALNTTRRVAVPLLELLDRTGATERVDDQLRTVR